MPSSAGHSTRVPTLFSIRPMTRCIPVCLSPSKECVYYSDPLSALGCQTDWSLFQQAADAAFHEQMSHSGNTSLFPSRKTSTNGLRRKADPFSPPTTPPSATANLPPSLASTIARSSSVSRPGFADDLSSPPRRASVDVGAVSLAFSRALERVDEIAAVDDLEVPTARAARAESELELAELLMGMHLETQRAVSSSGPDDEQLLRPMTPGKRRELAGKLDTWGFEPHMLDETDLFRCAQIMFQGAMWCEGLWELDIPQSTSASTVFACASQTNAVV